MKGQTILKFPFFLIIAAVIFALFALKKLIRALTFGYLFQSRNVQGVSGLPIEFVTDPDNLDIYNSGGC
ncbi:MAG: hypothetical protein HYT98_04285 [Candidatus Sungbacteria bacterium]|nr:hypothetical protein [Candidatus Sungbacteria bacterium]